MVLPRPSAMRGFAPARMLRAAVPRTASRQVLRRGYASGHGAEASSDIPWLVGSIAVTVPAVYYLWPTSDGGAHAHHDSHEEHAESEEPQEEESKEDPQEEEPKEESKEEPKEESKDESKDEPKEEKKDDSKDESKDDKPSSEPQSGKTPAEGESKSKATTEGANQPENKGDVEGVKFKGSTSEGDEQNRMPDERKVEPDSKGAYKKRIDSGYGKNLGESQEKTEDGHDVPSPAKPVSENSGDISNKQAGLSNTPTRHSTDITQDDQMSKKGEGAPDTAKSMGTIDVNRPTPEQNNKKDE